MNQNVVSTVCMHYRFFSMAMVLFIYFWGLLICVVRWLSQRNSFGKIKVGCTCIPFDLDPLQRHRFTLMASRPMSAISHLHISYTGLIRAVLKQYWTKSESYGSSGYVNFERLSVELFHSSRDLPILIFCHNDAPRIVFSIGESGILYQNCNNPGFAS